MSDKDQRIIERLAAVDPQLDELLSSYILLRMEMGTVLRLAVKASSVNDDEVLQDIQHWVDHAVAFMRTASRD